MCVCVFCDSPAAAVQLLTSYCTLIMRVCSLQPKLLEYNVRFGDPECQGLMMRLQSDLLPIMKATCEGNLRNFPKLQWSSESVLTVVMAAKGYPGSYEKATPIYGVEDITDAKVCQGTYAVKP